MLSPSFYSVVNPITIAENIVIKELLRGPSQKKCTECNTYRIEHQMCGKVL